MRVLGGIERPNGGSATISPSGKTACHWPIAGQPSLPEGSLADELDAHDVVRSSSGTRSESARIVERCRREPPHDIDAIAARLGRASAAMDSTGGWALGE